MKNWTIKALYYGKITMPKEFFTPGLDAGLMLDIPYLGYLLQNGEENVLVDAGIHEEHIVNSRAWGGYPAEGGTQFVLEALAREGLGPDDITSVIYTHLHNDHAGAAVHFKDKLTYVQKDEFANLFHQLPSQKLRGDFDDRTKEDILQYTNLCLIDNDIELSNGLKLYKAGGHTLGSQMIVVPTESGKYIIVGDLAIVPCVLFPQLDRMTLLDGKQIAITPAPEEEGAHFKYTSLIYDHFAACDSFYKMKALAQKYEPRYILCGHDPEAIVKHDIA
ncbi:N-acyl homoserine lactonase family protein [Papillibacter cinnamivorans]|uniref:Glyoxylase, beta-lactamase superfamily II n=1 Tax=Papillibacter cinnamivorans DSM 12816 TaxID=1122930 RepID=A0A1W2ABM2_9FIRM|nr:N-acyl homoserine lactonase family protein [Papillibacter cinnamivorans]SMC57882.1 Glyoxylase, beta-lactamase superfamily II [Papillibacter cinnamivorans DSM 12816]